MSDKFFCILFVIFQLFYSLFKSLHGKEMLIELKNDLRIRYGVVFYQEFLLFYHLWSLQGQAAFGRPISELQADRFAALTTVATHLCN
jgi:hypothetical protein